MNIRVFASVIITVLFLAGTAAFSMTKQPTPPGQADYGYGSGESYICNGFTEIVFGSGSDGSRVWYYIPDTLRNGSTAPVVVFLHGQLCIAPDIYMAHIEHLAKQGYIVIYPQFNKGGLLGLMSDLMTDADQNKYLSRAITGVNSALSRIGSMADRNNVTLYGHSLGGLLSLAWSSDAWSPKNIVLADACVDAKAGIPSFVQFMVKIVEIDWKTKIASTVCPVIVLTGNDDTLAPSSQALDIYDRLTNASSRVVYQLRTDTHGSPDLKADHMAPISDDGWMPSFIMEIFGGDGEVDATDYRFYWAALDAALNDETAVTFDMGCWSDGRAVNGVARMAP
ncbi:MAG: carboxylesterase family protein [Spirochaetes bacterium]|nr:carboxylesterase family protein [Spirochaetota bacterium]